MTAHDEGVQAQSSDLTNTPQSNYNQDNGGETKEAQANKRESQSIQPESQGRDHKQENDDGKDKVKKQEESNDEHDNEGKEKFEKEASQQQSEEGKSDSGNNNGGSKPKVSKEALEGPQSPAPTTKYDFDAEAKKDGSGKNTGKIEAGKPKDQKNQSSGSYDKKDKSSEHKHGGTLGHLKDKMHEHLGR